MNPNEVRELLDRAAVTVTPARPDPVSRMVRLGRRSVQRRRAWGAALATLVVATAVPFALSRPGAAPPAPASPAAVTFDGLRVAVPEGWKSVQVATFDPCTAEPNTVYLAGKQIVPDPCTPRSSDWIGIAPETFGGAISPSLLTVKDDNVIQGDESLPGIWNYRAFDGQETKPVVTVSGDEKNRERLLARVTWPAGPPAGPLALPAKITTVTVDGPGIPTATKAATIAQVRTALTGLHEQVPAGQECTLRKPGSEGFVLDDDVIVVLGNATCPQAVSNHGGRVRVPAGLVKQLYDLILKDNGLPTE
ncbi:hypothetical protein [Actinoplanes sp. HUAS TT8]|uniref:hypothetical protein n=1 Tax=Actinoplanes sp. HUAS TT8 TaxID=3447453 RepID=UPI003F526776